MEEEEDDFDIWTLGRGPYIVTIDIDGGPVDDRSISNQEATKQHWEEKFSTLDKDELFPKANIQTRNRFLQQESREEKGESLEPGEVVNESIGDLSQTKKIWEMSIQESEKKKQKEFKREKPLRQWSTSAPTTPTAPQGPDFTTADDEFYEESAIETEIRLSMERESMMRKEHEEIEASTPEPLEDEGDYTSSTYVTSSRPESVIEREIREQFEREETLLRDGQLRQAQVNKEEVQSEYERQEKEQERIDAHESIIERDIRLQREREEEVAKQHSVLRNIPRSVSAPISLQLPPEKQVQAQPPSVPSTPVQPKPAVQPPKPIQPKVEPVQHSQAPVQPVQRKRSTEQPPPRASMALGKDDREVLSYEAAIAHTAHPGESKIGQELRELREREQELRKSWQDRGMEVPMSSVKQTSWFEEELTPVQNNAPARRASVDSESSSRSTGSSTVQAPPVKETKVVKVQPYMGDSAEDDDRSYRYKPQNETPIERDIRLFKEREEALRREKGLLTPAPKQHKEVAQDQEPPRRASPQLYKPGDLPDGRLTMKRLATSRLQQEIQLEKQRELALRKEGIIHTTSEERIGEPMKYVEVTQPENANATSSPTSRTGKKNTYQAHRFSATKEQFNKPQDVPDGVVVVVDKKTVAPTSEPVASQSIAPAEKVPVPRTPSPIPQPVVSPPPPKVAPSVQNGNTNQNRGASQEVVMRRQKSSSGGQPPLANGEKFVIRRSINAAETKIEQELREMREREEELKRLRNISRGGSQALPQHRPQQPPLSPRAETVAPPVADEPAAPSATAAAVDMKKKRRSLLAEQWEQKFS